MEGLSINHSMACLPQTFSRHKSELASTIFPSILHHPRPTLSRPRKESARYLAIHSTPDNSITVNRTGRWVTRRIGPLQSTTRPFSPARRTGASSRAGSSTPNRLPSSCLLFLSFLPTSCPAHRHPTRLRQRALHNPLQALQRRPCLSPPRQPREFHRHRPLTSSPTFISF